MSLNLWTTAYGGAGSTPFHPSSLFSSGEKGALYMPWMPGSLWQDTAGTIPAGHGDTVGRMTDWSGNGSHATQATSASRPIVNVASGVTSVVGDAIDDQLRTASINLSHTSNVTIVASLSQGAEIGRMIAEFGTTFTGAGAWYLSSEAGMTCNVGGGGGYRARNTGAITNVRRILSGRYSRSGAHPDIKLDGASIAGTTNGSGTIAGAFGAYPLALLSRWNGSAITLPSNAALSAFLLIDRALTDDELIATEAYFAAQTGVTF